MRHVFIASSCLAAFVLACSGSAGPAGQTGPEGPQGPQGPSGETPDASVPITSLVSSLDLPESAPYPNSITSSADGTLFVGGLFGQLVKFSTSSTKGKVIAQIGAQGSVLANVMVDPKTSTLYACSDAFAGTSQNPFANPAATLYAFDTDGNPKGSWPLPSQGSSLCEDIAIAPSGDVYVTDPFLGAIDKLAAPVSPSSTIETWVSDALLQASSQNPVPPFGVHGVAVSGSSVIAGNFSTSSLMRIAIGADGKAGSVVKQKVELTNPERVVALDATHLLVAEDVWCGAGRLTELAQDANDADAWSPTVVKNGILGATSVTVANGSYYAVESQVCTIITQLVGGPTANPVLPFWIDRVEAY